MLQQSEPVFQLSLGIAGTYRLAHQRTIVTLHPQAPRLRGGDRGYGLGTRAAGPPKCGGQNHCYPPSSPACGGRPRLRPRFAGHWPAWCEGAWVRGPPARLVRGDEGYYLGPRATGPPGAGGGGYGLGPRATGPPGAERLLTARWIIGLLKYPLKLGKIRCG